MSNTTVKLFPNAPAQAMSRIQSNVVYELLSRTDRDGGSEPMQIGVGKFAKVYQAWQRSAGRNIRPVAIKVLHDHARNSDERLFSQEIDLLKDLSAGPNVNIVSFVDIVGLAPMIMCACGNIYHPRCPAGCGVPLERRDPPEKEHPSLACPKCDYELSGQHVQQRAGELLRLPAKPCCQSGPRAQRGHIINFVDREAMVMELLEFDLLRLSELRRAAAVRLCDQHGVAFPDGRTAGRAGWVPGFLRRGEAGAEHLIRVLLLEKVRLMVQLAETVAWLHAEKHIVHKDLAPDNVMIRLTWEESRGDWRGRLATFQDQLNDIACNPGFSIKLIDFGLADKEELTRSWYEEEVGQGNIKQPYLSPEARAGARKLEISEPLFFEPDPGGGAMRFRVPPDIYRSRLSILEGDILADQGDLSHDHDMEITGVVEDPRGSGEHYARVRGQPPDNSMNRRFQLVRRLGEPHDIYALGALFYFILTGSHEEVVALANLVDSLLDHPYELTPAALMRHPNYPNRRNAIREQFWQDELMILILRAMVRGQPQSFVQRRIDRGPGPAQQLLQETKRIYYGLQRAFWGG
jgi:serine/threonine protein kinase